LAQGAWPRQEEPCPSRAGSAFSPPPPPAPFSPALLKKGPGRAREPLRSTDHRKDTGPDNRSHTSRTDNIANTLGGDRTRGCRSCTSIGAGRTNSWGCESPFAKTEREPGAE